MAAAAIWLTRSHGFAAAASKFEGGKWWLVDVCWRPRIHSGGWGKDSSCQLKSSQSKKNTSHGPMIWDWSFGDPQAFFRRFHHIVQTFSLRFGRWLAGSSLWHSHLHKQTQNRQASIHANTHGSKLVVPSLQVILIYARPLVFEHSGPTDPPNQKEIKDCLSGHMFPRKKTDVLHPRPTSLKKTGVSAKLFVHVEDQPTNPAFCTFWPSGWVHKIVVIALAARRNPPPNRLSYFAHVSALCGVLWSQQKLFQKVSDILWPVSILVEWKIAKEVLGNST